MIARAIIGLIRIYQRFSLGVIPKCCRFYPTCSQYAIDAVSKYGAGKGSIKAAGRILRCSPLSEGGFDPLR